MTRLHIHLGYPKTGTTTLQRAFFDVLHRHGLIHYLGMFGFEADAAPDRRTFFTGLTSALYVEDDAFAASLPQLRGQFAQLCERVPCDRPVVLSNEHFVQSQWSTAISGERILPGRSAERLARVFDGADIALMVSFRRQDALLRSMFLEHASRPNHANPSAYATLAGYARRCQHPGDFHSVFYDFDRVMSGYQAVFPGAPVLAWTYEAFRDRQEDVLCRISAALGLGGIPDIIALPLDRQNARSNNGGDAAITRWSPLHRALYAMPGGPAIATAARRMPLLAAASNALKPRRTVPALDRHQAHAIRRLWAPSNARLASRFPAIAPDLRAEGYLSSKEARSSALQTA